MEKRELQLQVETDAVQVNGTVYISLLNLSEFTGASA
jgi:hypothetical protein